MIEIQGLPAAGMETQDSVGQPTNVPNTTLTVRGDIEPLNGREFFSAQQLLSEVTTRITIRYVGGVTTQNRLLSDGIYYDILAVIDVDMRHRELQLMCKSGLVDVG